MSKANFFKKILIAKILKHKQGFLNSMRDLTGQKPEHQNCDL